MICFEAVDASEVFFAGDGGEEHLAAFLALADRPDLHARRGCGERAEVGIDIFRVSELFRCADDIAERLLRRGDGARAGQVVDEFGEEEGLGGKFADLGGVFGVEGLCGLVVDPGSSGACEQEESEEASRVGAKYHRSCFPVASDAPFV